MMKPKLPLCLAVFITHFIKPGIIVLLLLFAWQPGLYAQTIRYVKPGATGSGTSWANASGDFQGMINASAANDEVWVAAGTYQPLPTQSFVMKEGVSVFGGFDGNGGSRNWKKNISVLQGNGNSVINNNNNGLTQTGILDGFTITGGNALHGGAIYNHWASPTIKNCTFSGNKALHGGAISNTYCTPIITNCIFTGNEASDDGGAVFAMLNPNTELSIVNCLFSGNKTVQGGAVYFVEGLLRFTNCTVSGNYEDYPGGVVCSRGIVEINNCILWGNAKGELRAENSSTITVNYSIVQGGYTGADNIDSDPVFIDAQDASAAPTTAGNYRLRLASPAINNASRAAYRVVYDVWPKPGTDLAGNDRNPGMDIDRGAYEFQYPSVNAATGIVFVKKDAKGRFNGRSWDDAYSELSEVLEMGPLAPGVKEIWIAEGTYSPAAGRSFEMKNGVAIYGGFAGNETSLSARNWQTNVTKLVSSGWHVIIAYTINTAILDGFTVSSNNNSIGIYNVRASPVIRNCTISENQIGIHNYTNASPVITNCVFRANGGGIVAGAMYNQNASNIVVTNCLFAGNRVDDLGAAIYNVTSALTINNCTFSGNRSLAARSAIVNLSGQMAITNSIISGNENNELAGSNLTVTNSIVKGGYAGTGNKDVDPLFVNPEPAASAPTTAGDYSLQYNSPAIHSGNNAGYNSAIDKDLAGNLRIMGAAIDMGAYEYQFQGQNINPVTGIAGTYGDADFEPVATATSGLAVTYASADNSIAEAFQDAADLNKWKLRIKKAGTVQITASQPGNSIYDAATGVPFNVTINPKAITITADAKSKTYGDADPVFTYTTSTPLVGADAFTGTLNRTAGDNAGTYAIGQGSLALNNNYTLAYTSNNFTINKALLTVTSTNKTICFDDAVGTIPVTYAGFTNSDNAASLTSLPHVNVPSFNTAGHYALTPAGGSAANYTFNYINGQLTVLPLPAGIVTQQVMGSGTVGGYQLAAPAGSQYLWSTGETAPSITVRASGNYNVKVTNQQGCSNNFTAQIKLETLSVPNTFSPNGDGVNDHWMLPELRNYPNAYVIIVNRDGQTVFESKAFTYWDGRYNGIALPAGVYFYRIRKEPAAIPVTGWLNLIK